MFHRDVTFYTRLMAFSGAGAVTGALVVAWPGKNRHGRMMLISLALEWSLFIWLRSWAAHRSVVLRAQGWSRRLAPRR